MQKSKGFPRANSGSPMFESLAGRRGHAGAAATVGVLIAMAVGAAGTLVAVGIARGLQLSNSHGDAGTELRDASAMIQDEE